MRLFLTTAGLEREILRILTAQVDTDYHYHNTVELAAAIGVGLERVKEVLWSLEERALVNGYWAQVLAPPRIRAYSVATAGLKLHHERTRRS